MLSHLIQFSLNNRALILGLSLVLLSSGVFVSSRLPIEVLPDLTKPTVTILTECPALAPEEVETLVTIPLESTLMSIPGISRLRTTSDVALSMTYVEFDWDTDIYHARRQVLGRLQTLAGTLPDGVVPYLSPVSSLMGEIMLIGFSSKNNQLESSDIRWIVDWDIRKKLLSIPGISEVLSMGGGIRQIQVQPDPHKLRAYDISFDEIEIAVREAVANTSGGFLVNRDQEVMVRHLAMTSDPDAIGNTVVSHDGTRPITLNNVAKIKWASKQMRGDAAINGAPGVILSITKSPGFDTIELTRKIEKSLEDIKKTLDPNIEITPIFKQADFINLAIGNLKEALELGGIMVTIVLALFLFNLRTTLITLMAIPLSLAITALIFTLLEVSVNSMTLGGIAVAIGMVVDDAIVDVENVFRRLKENASKDSADSIISVIFLASREVRSSIFYATIIIILSFTPLLALHGLSGRLFTPIAFATITSMGASFLVSLTVIPVLCSIFLKNAKPHKSGDNLFVRSLKFVFKNTWLKLALDQPLILLAISGILVSWAWSLYPQMARDFLPSFKEESILVALTASPGTSLEKTNELSDIADRLLKTVPEVKTVGRRVGRAEHGDHVVPVSTVEFDIVFQQDKRPRQEILKEIQEKMRTIPGTFAAISGPLADRIGHMLSGVSAPVAIKIFGPDLTKIRQIANKIRDIAREIPGLESARTEQQAPIPQLRIEIDRGKALAYGVTPGHINKTLATLMDGRKLGDIFIGERSVDLIIRLSDEWRENVPKLSQIYFHSKNGQNVPLSRLVKFNKATGPNVIHRENTSRRIVVSIKPTTSGLDQMINNLRSQIESKIDLPNGYSIVYEGEFKARQNAIERITLFAILGIIFILFLLNQYFRTIQFPAQVIIDILLSSTGGIALTYVLTQNISIATIVGLIAVAGIGARNSLMMISHYLHLMKHEGESFSRKMIERGTLERLIPVLMTAISAGLALIPLILAADQPGKEILYPVAVVICGGLMTSTLLGLGVTPAIFHAFGKRAATKSLERNASACD